MTNVDARLADMLAATRQPEAPAQAARTISVPDSPADAWCRENPGLCFGRGPTGRLRNFRAMNNAKLMDTYETVRAQNNDPDALEALTAEMQSRGFDRGV